MKTITRIQLTQSLYNNSNIQHSDCKKILDSIVELMVQGLEKDGKMLLSNFGLFNVLNKSKRIGRNPRIENSPSYLISERKSIKFKAAPILKAVIDKKYKEQFED